MVYTAVYTTSAIRVKRLRCGVRSFKRDLYPSVYGINLAWTRISYFVFTRLANMYNMYTYKKITCLTRYFRRVFLKSHELHRTLTRYQLPAAWIEKIDFFFFIKKLNLQVWRKKPREKSPVGFFLMFTYV